MYYVEKLDDDPWKIEFFYFNKEENAIKKAKEIYDNFVFSEIDSIEEWNKGYVWSEDVTYENTMRQIESGDVYIPEILDIGVIQTED